MGLEDQMADWGRRLAERESPHASELGNARRHASAIHARIASALDRFHESCREGGAEHLRVELSVPRTDDKHTHAVQFDLTRGRHQAIVTVKSRGEVTLVGPFQMGKPEGPCLSLPVASDEIEPGLAAFLKKFIDEAFRE